MRTFLESPPDGWRRDEGATTAPRGYEWWDNGEPYFVLENGKFVHNKDRKIALVKINRSNGKEGKNGG